MVSTIPIISKKMSKMWSVSVSDDLLLDTFNEFLASAFPIILDYIIRLDRLQYTSAQATSSNPTKSKYIELSHANRPCSLSYFA